MTSPVNTPASNSPAAQADPDDPLVVAAETENAAIFTYGVITAFVAAGTALQKLPSIPGVVPGQFDRPAGCLFSPRCAHATDLCRRSVVRQPPALGQALCNYPLRDGVPMTREVPCMGRRNS